MSKILAVIAVVMALACSGCPAYREATTEERATLSEQVAPYLHIRSLTRSAPIELNRLSLLELDGIRLELKRLNDNLEEIIDE